MSWPPGCARTGPATSLARLRSRVRARAVDAYVGGTAASVAAATAPRVYRQATAAKERALVTRLRSATAGGVSLGAWARWPW